MGLREGLWMQYNAMQNKTCCCEVVGGAHGFHDSGIGEAGASMCWRSPLERQQGHLCWLAKDYEVSH